MFEDPRLVFTGKYQDGVSISTLKRVWVDGGHGNVSSRRLCKILGAQEGKRSYFGGFVREHGSNHRGIPGWQFRDETVSSSS